MKYDIGKPYTVVAHHANHRSFNFMHKDGLPQKLGFRGPFVLGVANYGNMTRALVSHLGEIWLAKAIVEARFLKPVCEGDQLRIVTLPTQKDEATQSYETTAYNETVGNEICASMQTWVPNPFPEIDTNAKLIPNEWSGPVTQRRTWDNIIVGQAYRSLKVTLAKEDNSYWKEILEDDLPIYEKGACPPVHPSQILRLVQLGYNNQFIGDNAVHSSTRAVIRRMLRVGDSVDILTVPIKKWEKKQNHWLTIYCVVRLHGEVCVEIYHTQIIKLRGAESVLGSAL